MMAICEEKNIYAWDILNGYMSNLHIIKKSLFYKTLGINLTLGALMKDPVIFDCGI